MTTASLYDEILYPTGALEFSHPDRLATIATLFGMTPAGIPRCRVLELACGDGGNLIPMAFSLPESSFTGIDLAERPIAAGKDLAAYLGLRNLTLQAKDIMAITPEFGEFDYIIAHGLYAWVPLPVQEQVMAVCRANLAPNGVAFVSYNAYPGSRLRQVARDMFSYFVRPLDSSPAAIDRARELLGFAKRARPETGQWGAIMAQVSEFLGARPGSILVHDEMSEHYRPVYFHEFITQAQRHDLQYLGEAVYSEMDDRWLSKEELEPLSRLEGDPLLVREQYMDFLKCRTFRQTLLCRRGTELRRDLTVESVSKLLVSSRLRPVSEQPDLDSPKPEQFCTPEREAMTATVPAVKRLLARLAGAWPRRLPVAELISKDASVRQVGEFLLRLYTLNLVNLQVHWNPYVILPGERPESSRLARLQIERQERVTNQEHVDVKINDGLGRELLRRLDGTRDRAALLAELLRIDPKVTQATVENSLTGLANLALMTA